ncbi:hypothetical protein [Acidovorax sp. Leaf73]|uniref:hypothetical protein n=1 Tax=Acidovorax sp. Leaf73 TaxID=2876566 RepID=UPI001E4B7BA0|nr:hypothetical protein [Acidovorax sp. Leaf73]
MSYVLHLWRHPVPVSSEDARATLHDLRQQLSFSPDAAAGQLLEAIASALPPEGAPEDYWTEIPEPDPFALVQSLSPDVAELEVVLPVIECVARQLGWVVFDPQSGEVHTPSGQVMGPMGSVAAVEDVPVLPELDTSPSARGRWVQQSLEPLFTQRGWRKLRGEFWFKKKLPVGEALVYSDMVRDTLHHGVWIRLALPSHLQPALDSDGGPAFKVSLQHFAQMHRLPFTYLEPPALFQKQAGGVIYELPMGSADSAATRRDELAALYDRAVLDWLDQLHSLEDLDRWANRVPDEECPFVGLRQRSDYRLLNYHPDLLVAAAVNAPDFAQRALERYAMYEVDAFGRGLLPQMHELLAVCGLHIVRR